MTPVAERERPGGTFATADVPSVANAAVALVRRPPRPSLVDLAYDAIVEAIVDRRIKPGARIGIDALASQLEMSGTPVREALARAAAKRLVVQSGNRGFKVTPLLSEREYHHLWDVRRLLEIHAVETGPITAETVARLRAITSRMPLKEPKPVYRDFKTFNEADREFHHVLVAMAGNASLLRAWSDLHFHLHVGRLYAGVGLIDFGDALTEHAGIVELMESGGGQAVAGALRRHIHRAEDRLLELVTTSGPPSEDR